MICRKCKQEIPDDSNLCCYCGTKVIASAQKVKARGNGYGTAIRRGRGWEARVVVGWKDKKTPIRRSKGGFSTKREALDYCVKLKESVVGQKRQAPSLKHYWDTFSTSSMLTLSKSKQVAYKGAWKKLEAIHLRFVDTIEIAELRELVAKQCTTYYTARDCKVLLNHLFELAGAEGWVSKDIPSYIVLPPLKEKERQTFTEKEQKALWQLYESGDLDAAIPLLMICTGMMPGEMQALRVEHINLEEGQIIGAGMKTKVRKSSPIYLPSDIIPVVQDLIAHAQPTGYIFIHNEAKWYEAYYHALEKAKCRRLEPYCCRHSTATRLAISEGIAPQTIQRAMRWSTSKMLDRYAHPDHKDVAEAMNTIKKPE